MPVLTPLIDADTALYRTCFGKGLRSIQVGENLKINYRTSFLEVVDAMDHFLFWVEGVFERPGRLFLSDNVNNFRNQVATIKPYKGNRDPGDRPPYYADMREYLVNEWKAIVSENCEADDLIASLQREDTVIVSIDKDFKQVVGYNFNPVKNELTYITESLAWFNFYRQMLMGDVADNIPGINRIGEVKSARLLEDKTREEMDVLVRSLYDKQYGEDGPRAFEEIRTLLWLRRDIKL
jgi:hypothetical protein